MYIIETLIGTPLGALIDFCYELTGNFGLCIILFTFLVKIILFPISLMSQKNSIKLFKLQPALEDIKARYSGEFNEMLKEQKALYKREKYSTLKATLPLLIQIPIIIGVVRAVSGSVENGGYDFIFCGLDLSVIPTINSALVIIPLLSALSALLMCFVQNALNPLTKMQGFLAKWGTAGFLTIFSGYFAFVLEAGFGLFWITGNLLGALITIICTLIYNPKKYVDLSSYSVSTKRTKEDRAAAKERKRIEKLREKEDVKRFFSNQKQLVFYSEASGFYKYFQVYIEYILENSDITVHYLTSDINDQVFDIKHPRFETYYCGANGLITVFMKMDADVVAMTMPDLEVYHYKRSLVKKDIEYIYIDHGMGSFNLMLRKGALDSFDTIFCYGKNHNEEIRAMEEVYKLAEKKLVNVGFGLLDIISERYNKLEKTENLKPQILIAPSWQKDNILEYCLDELMEGLLSDDYKLIIRPHPEFIKRFPLKMKQIFNKYEAQLGERLEIQTDFSSNSTVYLSDLIITDWSSIALEFSLTTKKPSLFINTPMKVMNPEWQKINVEPMDLWIRDMLGVSLAPDELFGAGEVIGKLLGNKEEYRNKIDKLINDYMYNIGEAAHFGGNYIIEQIKELDKNEN
ncbi:MAG: membrane protein insertase YidC [Oscillospiraceae bacterium]|nr:membrane protein insertase YidC [Oscillospiraceae bacterium]